MSVYTACVPIPACEEQYVNSLLLDIPCLCEPERHVRCPVIPSEKFVYQADFSNGSTIRFSIRSEKSSVYPIVIWTDASGEQEIALDYVTELADIEVEIGEDLYRVMLVRDVPMVYHGTYTFIEEFDPAYTGRGNDQYGSGFYFTSEKRTALSYTSGEDPCLVSARVFLQNPLRIDGTLYSNLRCVPVRASDAARIILFHPHIRCQPDAGVMNPIGAYLDGFWDRSKWTDEELCWFAKELANQYFSDTNLLELSQFFRDFPTKGREAFHSVLGFDGVEISFGEETQYVAWFPEQILILDCESVEGNDF